MKAVPLTNIPPRLSPDQAWLAKLYICKSYNVTIQLQVNYVIAIGTLVLKNSNNLQHAVQWYQHSSSPGRLQ